MERRLTEKQNKVTEGRGCASKKVDIIHPKYFDDYMSVFHCSDDVKVEKQ